MRNSVMTTYLRCLACGQAWQPPETQPIAPCPSCASTDVRRFPIVPFTPPARSSPQEQSVGMLLFVACGVLALVLLPILLFAIYLGLTHVLR